MTFKPVGSVMRPEMSDLDERPVTMRVEYIPTENVAEAGANVEERTLETGANVEERKPAAGAIVEERKSGAGANEKRKPMGETKLAEFSELLRYVLMRYEKANECKERQEHIKAFIAKYQVCAPTRVCLFFFFELPHAGCGRNQKNAFQCHFTFLYGGYGQPDT